MKKKTHLTAMAYVVIYTKNSGILQKEIFNLDKKDNKSAQRKGRPSESALNGKNKLNAKKEKASTFVLMSFYFPLQFTILPSNKKPPFKKPKIKKSLYF